MPLRLGHKRGNVFPTLYLEVPLRQQFTVLALESRLALGVP